MSGDGKKSEEQFSEFMASVEGEFKRMNSIIRDLASKLTVETAERLSTEKKLVQVQQQLSETKKQVKSIEKKANDERQELKSRLARVEKDLEDSNNSLRQGMEQLYQEVTLKLESDHDAMRQEVEQKLKINAGFENAKSKAAKASGTGPKGLDDSSVYEEASRLRRKTGRSRALPHSPVSSRSSSASSEIRGKFHSDLEHESERFEKKKFKFKVPRQFKSCNGADPSEFLDWLAKIERTASASRWSNGYKCWLAANLVEGRAAQILDSCNDEVRNNWKELRKKLVKRVVSPQHFEHLRNELRRLHQSSFVDTQAYILEFRDKARKAYANNTTGKYEDDIVRMFISGLNSEDLRLKTLEQQCRTLDDATEYVLNIITLQELAMQKPTSTQPTFAYYATPPEAERSSRHSTSFEPPHSPSWASGRTTQSWNIQCYGCGEYGHVKRRCSNILAHQHQQFDLLHSADTRPSCTQCGQKGHSRFQCHRVGFDRSPRRNVCQVDSGYGTFPATTTDDDILQNSSDAQGPVCYVTLGSLNHQRYEDLQALIPCELGANGSSATALVDNGSCCNILKETVYRQLVNKERLEPSGIKTINSLSGHSLKVIGKIRLTIGLGDTKLYRFATTFHVVSELPFDVIIGAEGMFDGYLRTDIRNKVVCAQVGQQNICVPFLSKKSAQHGPSCAFEHCSKPRAGSFDNSRRKSHCRNRPFQQESKKTLNFGYCGTHVNRWYCPLGNELVVINDKMHSITCARVCSSSEVEQWDIRNPNVVLVENLGTNRPFIVHQRYILPLKRHIHLLPRTTRRQEALYHYVLNKCTN